MNKTNKGAVTLLSYMLGVSDSVLERYYLDDYKKLQDIPFSDELKIIRCFSRVRQNIFKHYKYYKGSSLVNMSTTYIDEELMYLKEKGYDLVGLSKLDGSVVYLLNEIKKDVDYLMPIVLDKLKLQYVKELQSLFDFPIFDKKSILNFISGLKGVSLPHGVIIPRYKRVVSSIQYLLSSDISLYGAAFTLSGKEFTYDSYVEPYDFGLVIGVNSDVTKDIISSTVGLKESTVGNLKDIAPSYLKEVPTTVKSVISDTLKVVGTSGIYLVDCDNVDFFKFLSMLDILKSNGVVGKTFYLYTDVKATYLWDMIEDSDYVDYFNFNYKRVDRLKGNKSVVDLVITVDICKEVMQNKTQTIGLISSDSDFYGVMENVDANYVVGYSSDCTSSNYLHYLSKKDYSKFDIKVFEKEETLLSALDKVVTYMTLSVLSTIAISAWDKELLVESIRCSIEKESSYTVDFECVRDRVYAILSDLSISLKDNVLYFSYGDVAIKIKNS